MSGEADQMKGRVKQAAGDLADDDDLKREGKRVKISLSERWHDELVLSELRAGDQVDAIVVKTVESVGSQSGKTAQKVVIEDSGQLS